MLLQSGSQFMRSFVTPIHSIIDENTLQITQKSSQKAVGHSDRYPYDFYRTRTKSIGQDRRTDVFRDVCNNNTQKWYLETMCKLLAQT